MLTECYDSDPILRRLYCIGRYMGIFNKYHLKECKQKLNLKDYHLQVRLYFDGQNLSCPDTSLSKLNCGTELPAKTKM